MEFLRKSVIHQEEVCQLEPCHRIWARPLVTVHRSYEYLPLREPSAIWGLNVTLIQKCKRWLRKKNGTWSPRPPNSLSQLSSLHKKIAKTRRDIASHMNLIQELKDLVSVLDFSPFLNFSFHLRNSSSLLFTLYPSRSSKLKSLLGKNKNTRQNLRASKLPRETKDRQVDSLFRSKLVFV